MSAPEVASKLIAHMTAQQPDFICLNFANPDMVGHTGVYAAILEAVETVDAQLQKVVEAGLALGYEFLIIADHGNADFMLNEDGSPNTAHSLNLVPFFIIDKNWKGNIHSGKLGDLAPTILKMMELPIPKEMTGTVLIQA
jgi:2,3-bisphosphoglycerate-independent phosphoglycerate mutase